MSKRKMPESVKKLLAARKRRNPGTGRDSKGRFKKARR